MNKLTLLRNILSFYATVAIPLLYICNIYLIYRFSNTLILQPAIIMFGLTMGAIGMVFWVLSMITLGFSNSFGVLPRKQKRVKSGIYKYFAHPMYIGIWFTFTGLSLASQSKEGLLFTNLLTLPLLIIRAVWEDRYLYD